MSETINIHPASERFCTSCGAMKQPQNTGDTPLRYCGMCGAAQYSTPQGTSVTSALPGAQSASTSSLQNFRLRMTIAAVAAVLLGSGSYAVTRLLTDSPATHAEAAGTRNSAQNNGSDEGTGAPAGDKASGNPMSKVSPELQQRIAVLQDSLQRFPKNGAVVLSMANAWYDAGAFFQAEQYYSRYLTEFDAKNVGARVDYAYTLLRQNRPQEAITETKKALEYEPDRVEALYNLGVIYYGQKDFEQAKEWFRRCIKTAPGTEIAKSAADIVKSIEERTAQQGS